MGTGYAAPRDGTPVYCAVVPEAGARNARLLAQFLRHREHPAVRRSHYFGGRYENLYLPDHTVPAAADILAFAAQTAQQILPSRRPLRCGYWFNATMPGECTQAHCHDDYDEQLAAVYYVQTPPACGALILHLADEPLVIEPRAGHLVFFPPQVVHEVSTHRGTGLRLSLAMNFGYQETAATSEPGRD